jgi:hypothetical protein
MSRPGFTKGPWRRGWLNSVGVAETRFFICGADRGIVACPASSKYSRHLRSPDEENANLDLIAAAPEMYEALRQVAEMFAGDDSDEHSELYSVINAALAKAEGKVS